MNSTSLQNISSNSWKTLPKAERKKLILDIQKQNNELTLQIDEHQKELCAVRATVPEECRRIFEEEIVLRKQRALNAPLLPGNQREGMSDAETQRMKTLIRERVERHIEERRSADEIEKEAEEKSGNAQLLRQNVLEMAQKLLETINQ